MTITTNPNPVDYLKYVMAEAVSRIEAAQYALSCDAWDMPAEVAERLEATVQGRLDGVRRIVTEAAAVFCRDGRDMNTYSDGRPVKSRHEIDHGTYAEYVWHPHAGHPDNQPQQLHPTATQDGRRKLLVIAAPGVLDSIDMDSSAPVDLDSYRNRRGDA